MVLRMTDDSMVTQARRTRVREMLQRRLGSVVVVAEAIHRRHNTSAILRSAEAFGVHEVHLITGAFRPSRGAARGAERWVDIHFHESLSDCVRLLRTRNFSLWVADLHAQSCSPEGVPLDGPVAVLFGSEMSGVSDEARRLADGFVTVPMHGLTESLNVSVACACVLQRITERRRAQVGKGDLAQARQDRFFHEWLDRETKAYSGMSARNS